MSFDLLVDVPQFYTQIDSRTRHADRKCFSSTVAMAIKFLRPDSLIGSNADDDYLRTVLRFGDTTQVAAQQRAIREYGLDSTFSTTASVADLERILRLGRPVPVAWLHHGHVSRPSGGGHWTLLTGLTATHTRHHDPYGEADMVNGGYVHRSTWRGSNIRYTRRNWLPRWQAGGQAWILDVFDPHKQQSPSPEKASYDGTWKGVRAVAHQMGARWPQVVAAQWALESGWGKHTSGTNNFFGIKGTPGTEKQTMEFLDGSWVTIRDTFRDYRTPEDSIADLIRLWYKDYRGFLGVNRANSWQECCRLLRKEGYATDPKYPEKLIDLIEDHDK